MGALNSILDYTNDDYEDEVKDEHTPSVARHKRLLDLDPRSPSTGILRTPIVLDKTTAASGTPESAVEPSSIVDPRSPTSQFLRTPILPNNETGKCHQSPAGASIATSRYASSESGIDSRETSPDVVNNDACISALTFDSPDSAISEEEAGSGSDEDNSVTSLDQHVGTPLRDLEKLRLSDNHNRSGLVHRKLQAEETPKSQSVPKMRGPMDKRLNALSNKSQIPVRSPLASVNSPRPDCNSTKTHFTKQPTVASVPDISHAVCVDKENQI